MLEELINKMVTRYVVTSAQKGVGYNKNLLNNIDKYCKDHDAELIILPMAGKSITEEEIHRDLQIRTVVEQDYNINKNIKIKNHHITPQQINPLTGIERFAQGDKSFIFAGTKQVLKYVANSYDTIPKAIMTTGAITKPNYRDNRIGRIAKEDHEMGFVVVEKQSNSYFHFRQVKALKNGNFTDILGTYRNGKKYKDLNANSLIIGDLHPYDTNPIHEKNTFEQIKHLGKHVDLYLHDTFNGRSISHHYKNDFIRQHEVFKEQGLNLEKELEHTLKAINKYAESTWGKTYIVASNHDEHLHRYLKEGRFVGDKGNSHLGAILYAADLEGYNPLEFGLRYVGALNPRVEFIERDEGHKVLGYELGNHGDLGANGGRGSPRSIEHDNAKSITGHRHSAMKIRNTYGVGTSTHLRLDYNRGFSNWTNTNGVLYNNGTVQLLNSIKRKWKL